MELTSGTPRFTEFLYVSRFPPLEARELVHVLCVKVRLGTASELPCRGGFGSRAQEWAQDRIQLGVRERILRVVPHDVVPPVVIVEGGLGFELVDTTWIP